MSTSSGPKNRAPAHQNKFAFRHNKNSKLSRQLQTVGTGGLCKRCADKIEWRKKYRKYKPLSAPRKCNMCGEKKVKAAYRTICPDCAAPGGQCENCAETRELKKRVATQAEQAQEHEALQGVLDGLRERDKRTVLRRQERGEDVYEIFKEFVDLGSDGDADDGNEDGDDDDDGAGGSGAKVL